MIIAVWRGLCRLNHRIENCWVGDLIGVGSLFVGLYAFLLMTGVW